MVEHALAVPAAQPEGEQVLGQGVVDHQPGLVPRRVQPLGEGVQALAAQAPARAAATSAVPTSAPSVQLGGFPGPLGDPPDVAPGQQEPVDDQVEVGLGTEGQVGVPVPAALLRSGARDVEPDGRVDRRPASPPWMPTTRPACPTRPGIAGTWTV